MEQLLRPFPAFTDFAHQNRLVSQITFALGFLLSIVYVVPFMVENDQFDRTVYCICASLMGILTSVCLLLLYCQGQRNLQAIDRFREMNATMDPKLMTVLERLKENQKVVKRNGSSQTLLYGVIMG